MSIWIMISIFLPASQISWYLTARTYGWPTVTVYAISQNNYFFVVKAYIPMAIIANFPDVVSVIIYVAMLRHMKRTHNSVAPISNRNEPDMSDTSNDSGGIWVGDMEVEPSTPPPTPDQSPAQNNSDPPSPNDHQEEKSQHEVNNVMKVLKWHVLSSSLDLTLILYSTFICSLIGLILTVVFAIVNHFVIPLLVVKNNFKHLGGMWVYLKANFCPNI